LSVPAPTVAIAANFLDSYAGIPRSQQRKVMRFLTKFRQNPASSGINYEKIRDSADPNFRSVRIDQDYRGIITSPPAGDVYVLLWVAKHDDAYEWARRHVCGVNPNTGSLQLFESASSSPMAQTAPSTSSLQGEPLFSLREREFLRLGVPAERLDLVRSLQTVEELEAIESRLPKEAFEALYLLAAGCDLQEVIQEYDAALETHADTSDFSHALTRRQSQGAFQVVSDEAELEAMLSAPLEKWRVFLHPSQRRLVEWNVNGPIRVLGGAGTGKTVVAMHRARWLARNIPHGTDGKILFTTFTANLAVDIAEHLKSICNPAELARIESIHIDGWISRYLRSRNYPNRIVYAGNREYSEAWEVAMASRPRALDLPDSFYVDEWERVVLGQEITEKPQYLAAKRIGRGVPLTRAERSQIWPVFEEFRKNLEIRGLRCSEDATRDAIRLLEEQGEPFPYLGVLVDEAQDMGPEVMRLIRRMVKASANDLFIVGDGHQRIYRRRFALTTCGIEVRGRSRKLRINYRTTAETQRFALSVLEGVEVDDLDGGEDSLEGYCSLIHGESPEVSGLNTQSEEISWLSKAIVELRETGVRLSDICIVARTNSLLETYRAGLERFGLPCVRLSRSNADDRGIEGVRLASMHRVKGLEFHFVFVVGANRDFLPLRQMISSSEDVTEKKAGEQTERALFHVALTRAIKKVFVSYFGEPSSFFHQ
jgi:superfamily I DNA/RNA helicase